MTMSEYEERFESPTPPLHQTLAATYRPNRARRRSRRLWVAVALAGVITMTCKATLDHTPFMMRPVMAGKYGNPATEDRLMDKSDRWYPFAGAALLGKP
jgi:hypothetical protein